MSTNLQLSTNFQLPEIRLPEIRIPTSVTSYSAQTTGGESGGVDEVETTCRTPTSAQNKIPEIFSCPPAPRKPKRKVALSCKRKLFDHEFQFFEIANREEVESFFRSSYQRISDSPRMIAKRRCKCT